MVLTTDEEDINGAELGIVDGTLDGRESLALLMAWLTDSV